MKVVERLSPNRNARRNGWTAPELVVLHYTAMTGGPEPAIKRLSLPETEVSAHYLICEAGGITCLVPEAERAWHAGAGRWGECWDVNSASIGIELSNDGASPFAAAQMDALEDLLADILARHDLPPQAVIGHSDTAPGRKRDPGPRFDWRRLALRGLAIWPEPADGEPPDPTRFRDLARTAGYTAEVDDETLLAALRLRFRPGARGPLDARDMALVADIAARYPVHRAALA